MPLVKRLRYEKPIVVSERPSFSAYVQQFARRRGKATARSGKSLPLCHHNKINGLADPSATLATVISDNRSKLGDDGDHPISDQA
jgi:hypothetical protein